LPCTLSPLLSDAVALAPCFVHPVAGSSAIPLPIPGCQML
jgi:hypothetical protein